MNNAFLNVVSGQVQSQHVDGQAVITQDQYTQILLANLRQIWTDYGELAEVWFDGGYPPGTADLITALLAELQPNAVAFQGPGKNVIRWVGTESGHAPTPCWSTSDSDLAYGAGSPTGSVWAPAETDTCLQTTCLDSERKLTPHKKQRHSERVLVSPSFGAPYSGCWFYNPNMCPKSHSELVSIYHDSVGRNSFLLLDWTPTPEGTLPATHIAAYEFLGNYVAQCYGKPLAQTSFTGLNSTLRVDASIDRVVLREDQQYGQRVRSFSVAVNGKVVYTAESVGNRHIALLAERVAASTVSVVFADAVAEPHVSLFAVYDCDQLDKELLL
eukprot:TRINITY_DN9444_c0_g1_i2.p1 TRINITY_DN9444_c0_g1~~TRINITY_DN9444_c0_g1_i2.p1  ORF type:complete len:328 (-),score=60.50 TRINITY_DN9444_c0_g1_i2:126-1109(-)